MSMTDAKNVPTPELDKQSEVIHSGKTATAQEFYDWLIAQGVVFAKNGAPYEVALVRHAKVISTGGDAEPKYRVNHLAPTEWRCEPGATADLAGRTYLYVDRDGEPTDTPIREVRENPNDLGYHPLFNVGGQRVLEQFFGIDGDKIEAERRALLEAIRA